MEIFQEEGQSLTVKGKGVLPATLGEPWTELEKIVQSYITCEGRKDVVRPRHLKLLAVLKGKCSINLPALLNSLLHDAARSLKKAQHIDAVVSHHRLIRLIVSHSLTQQQSTWEEVIAIVEGDWMHHPQNLNIPPARRNDQRNARNWQQKDMLLQSENNPPARQND